MWPVVLYALPKAFEHLPLRIIYEALVAKILKRGYGVRPGFPSFSLPEFDKQVFHKRTDLAVCGFQLLAANDSCAWR